MSSGNNQGQGSSSSSNETIPLRGQSPSDPRTTPAIVAAGSPSPNRPQKVSPVFSGSSSRPVIKPVIAGSPSSQPALLAFPRSQTSPQRPRGMIAPRPLAPGQGGPTGGSTGLGLQGPFGLYGVPGAMAVPVGGRAGGSLALDRLRLVGNESSASKKRGVDGEGASGGDGEIHRCTLCTKTFRSIKALFGHLRSHPERGYKGAHPPPTFDAEVEFCNFPGVNLPGVVQDDGGQAAVADAQEEDIAQAEVGATEEVAVGPPRPFRVLDLNDSPSSSDE